VGGTQWLHAAAARPVCADSAFLATDLLVEH